MTIAGATCALAGCPEPAATPASEAPPPVDERATEQPVPSALLVDAEPVAINVPAPPSFDLVISESAEYELRATGSPMDPVLFLFSGADRIDEDDDGGDGRNARLIRFLEPGHYTVRIAERTARPFTVQLQVRRLPPLTPVATLALGEAAIVTFEDAPLLRRPHNDRDASRALTLEVSEADTYTCTAAASANRDATMTLIHDGAVLATDDDSGEGNDARIEQALDPGIYEVRVRDYRRLVNMEITVRCERGA